MDETASPVILIVEDQSIISATLSEVLSDHGFHVVGPYRTNAAALAYLEASTPEAAIIDLNLLDGVSDKTAQRLEALGVQFLVISGNSKDGRYGRVLESAEWLEKPFSERELTTRMDRLLARR